MPIQRLTDCAPAPLPAMSTTPIILATLNARFIHASLGLRYLRANMGELRAQTQLLEFTIKRPTGEIVDELLRAAGSLGSRAIIGFGVYIWNVRETTEVLRQLKAARPDITVVLGGPEVSHESAAQEIVRLAEHVITGWGDLSFARLCGALIAGEVPAKIIAGEQPPLAAIAWPYSEYSDRDLAHRLLYVEASRGCPFKCEFCLSALDKTAWAFDLDGFLAQMEALYRRGARHFKFVDRTFNLKIDASIRILEFFLERLADGPLFLHFEVIPDHLPDRLKDALARFPAGVLQLEIGVQSFNPEVQHTISRRQDNVASEANLRWLLAHTHAHLHADLIFGLPGENLESFALGFDRLYALRPHEIQLGLLKRLRGTPIIRHSGAYAMLYAAEPPYSVISTAAVDASTVQRFVRLARYWDLIANSGRFKRTLERLLDTPTPFYAFLAFTDWFWAREGKTSGISPEMLVDSLHEYLVDCRQLAAKEAKEVQAALMADYTESGARSNPAALRQAAGEPARQLGKAGTKGKEETPESRNRRQARHQGKQAL